MKIAIDGKTIRQINNEDGYDETSVEVEFQEGPVIQWESTDTVIRSLPDDKHGVYVIYDDKGCLYVGKTWQGLGFRGRIRTHKNLDVFSAQANFISLFYIDGSNTQQILLFERIKIAQLNPTLNRDDDSAKIKSDSIRDESHRTLQKYFQYFMLCDEIAEKLVDKGISEEQFQKKLLNHFNEIRRTISYESLLYDNRQIDESRYICDECSDTGLRPSDDQYCDCLLGMQMFFDKYGFEKDDQENHEFG